MIHSEPCIVVLAPDAGGNGSVSNVVRQHARLIGARYPVVLMSRTAPADSLSGVEPRPVTAPLFHWLRRFAHVPNDWAFARAARRTLMRLRQQRPVALVLCHSHALAALAALPVKQRFGIPFGVVVHANIFAHPPGTYDPRLTRYYRWVSPIAYRNADLVTAISSEIARQAREHGAHADRVRVIPNGIDPGEIGLDDAMLPEDRVRPLSTRIALLYVGRLSIEKGIADLVETSGLLRDSGLAFTLDIVGDGPLRVGLEHRVSALDLTDRVRFLGVRQRNQLGRLYAEADLTCVPSQSEGQGIVVLESLVAGTPVLGSAVGGIPDMIQPGINGLLIPPGESMAWAKAIERLAREHNVLRTMTKACRASVQKAYSWDVIGSELGNVIEDIIHRQN